MKRLNFNPFSEDGPPASRADALEGASREAQTPTDELVEGARRNVTITVPGYGGLTVQGGEDPTLALLHVLDVLVRHRLQVEPVLVEYEVLLAQLPQMPVEGFCVRRSTDGWTLAVPVAETRPQALLQIVQALLALQRTPFASVLRAEGIVPHRL